MTSRAPASQTKFPFARWNATANYGELHFENGTYLLDAHDFTPFLI